MLVTACEAVREHETVPRDPAAPAAQPTPIIRLAVCRSLVLAHGGRFWSNTRDDEGFRSSFTLPIMTGKASSGPGV